MHFSFHVETPAVTACESKVLRPAGRWTASLIRRRPGGPDHRKARDDGQSAIVDCGKPSVCPSAGLQPERLSWRSETTFPDERGAPWRVSLSPGRGTEPFLAN